MHPQIYAAVQRDPGEPPHNLRPRDTKAAYWRHQYAELEREAQRLVVQQPAPGRIRQWMPFRFALPFIGGR